MVINDQVLIEIHRARQTVIAQRFVDAVDSLLLLLPVHDRGKADTVIADLIVKSGVSSRCQNIGTADAAGDVLAAVSAT